jgi:hypothetical protein
MPAPLAFSAKLFRQTTNKCKGAYARKSARNIF